MANEKDKKPVQKEESKKTHQKKVDSVKKMTENIESMRRKVRSDMKSDDEKLQLVALAVAVMDKTSERVGNEDSASDGHFGVTGFRCKHVEISGSKVTLSYTGKSGVEHEKEFSDAAIAKLLKKCKDRCSKGEDDLFVTSDGFKLKADKVNRYLEDFEVTAKDIRGYSVNKLVVDALRRVKVEKDEKERKKQFLDVLRSVAEKVGHNMPTLRKYYLMTWIEEGYLKDGSLKDVKTSSLTLEDVRRIASRVALDMRGDL